ncbi:MAG: hypothetical protein N3A68_07370 [Bacteroidia bacterium]|nr:hypothetical protein [Bacteroidia bacterium]
MQSSDLVTLWKTAWERFKCHWGAGVAISFFNIPWVLILVWHRYLLIITPVFVLIFYVFLANYGLIAWNYSGSLSFRQYFPSLEAFFKVIMGFILFTLLAIAYSLDEIYSREDSTGRDNGNELYFGEDSTRATSQGKWYFQEDPMEAIGHGEWYVQEDSMRSGSQSRAYSEENSIKESKKIDKNPLIFLFFFVLYL